MFRSESPSRRSAKLHRQTGFDIRNCVRSRRNLGSFEKDENTHRKTDLSFQTRWAWSKAVI